jgi:hypothetical protein
MKNIVTYINEGIKLSQLNNLIESFVKENKKEIEEFDYTLWDKLKKGDKLYVFDHSKLNYRIGKVSNIANKHRSDVEEWEMTDYDKNNKFVFIDKNHFGLQISNWSQKLTETYIQYGPFCGDYLALGNYGQYRIERLVSIDEEWMKKFVEYANEKFK